MPTNVPLRVFIGWDPRQSVSYHVLAHSILKRSTRPVTIAPLVIESLPLKRQGLTPFTFSRFLVPWLCDFQGQAAFIDADMLMLGDAADLFALARANTGAAISVARGPMAFEFASLMLFDCAHFHNRRLTPEFVEATTEPLHKIGWTDKIGDLPREWNHLVGYDQPRTDAKLVHYTQGVPFWPETKGPEYTDEWIAEAREAFSAQPWADLMGRSVHAKPVIDRLISEGKIKPEQVRYA